jgi:hypothetical protein
MGCAMNQIFTSQFWQEVIARAPWVIPSLLIGGLVGWKWKGTNDDGEIRGLRAEVKGLLDVTAQRLELARQKYEAVVDRENELNDTIARQEKVIAELKKVGVAPPRFAELSTSSTDIKNALTNLSTSTTSLGQALNGATRAKRSKIKLVGKAVLNLPPKLLKIRYALVVNLSSKTHLPLRTVLLIFLSNFLNAKPFSSCGDLGQSRRNESKEEYNECRQYRPQC